MLELDYDGGLTSNWLRTRRFNFRNFGLTGTTADLEELIATLNGVAASGRPAIAPISEGGTSAWLVVARSDSWDLELVHLDPGVLLAGDAESLRQVATDAGWCIQQALGPQPLNGYHAHIDVHDVHNLSQGRLEHAVAELRITWVEAEDK